MSELTARQRAHLRSLAQRLKAQIQVGKEGVTDRVAQSVVEALSSRELLKVRLLESAPANVRDAAVDLQSRVAGVAVVQVIGRTIVLYRAHPDNPQIELPR